MEVVPDLDRVVLTRGKELILVNLHNASDNV